MHKPKRDFSTKLISRYCCGELLTCMLERESNDSKMIFYVNLMILNAGLISIVSRYAHQNFQTVRNSSRCLGCAFGDFHL